jgi:hypothetical protein
MRALDPIFAERAPEPATSLTFDLIVRPKQRFGEMAGGTFFATEARSVAAMDYPFFHPATL